ncbi:phosphotransferase family protein [Paenibacillus sp. N3.4]|uniref:phosphotransferase family protein n=1 Tax=Paenibacillus sp. N3.4 TaxID=2603222 RepID=UPI0011C70F14|nr:phosphotransferase [Paenibacillus sp. N3.4]TXK83667.1 phosphotransferase [Paenibacillus sp. N3.4]
MENAEVHQVFSEEMKQPAFIHGDVTIPNIVINSDNLYLVDWDGLTIGSRYNEIAKALLNTSFFNPDHIKETLQGYEEIQSFNSAERLLISALFRLPREAWSAARNIAYGRGPRDIRILERTWDERLKAIRWLDNWALQLPNVKEDILDINK